MGSDRRRFRFPLPHDERVPPLPLIFRSLSLLLLARARRPGYFEVDIDVGSSTLASNATHLAGGYAKNLVLDLAFALQVNHSRTREPESGTRSRIETLICRVKRMFRGLELGSYKLFFGGEV